MLCVPGPPGGAASLTYRGAQDHCAAAGNLTLCSKARLEDVDKQLAGISVQTVRNIGISFGAALIGMVAAMSGLTDNSGVAELVHAMHWVYGVSIGFSVLALLAVIPVFIHRHDPPG